MRVTLDYEETASVLLKEQSSDVHSFVDIANLVVNPSPAKAVDDSSMGDFGIIEIGNRLLSYYIISERSLLPALEDLATWKTQKGYRVVKKAIEDVYEDSRYKVGIDDIVDEAASLRKYLQDEYDSHGTFFCLLVGDHRTRIPIRKIFDSRYEKPYYDPCGDDYIPTDNYFSDLSKDQWKVSKDFNGMFVCDYMNQDKFEPYIYLGRLLCHTEEEIHNYTRKLILYETNPGRGQTDYLENSMIFVQFDGSRDYKETLNKMTELFELTQTRL